ncbi:MAG: ComF family protein [Candidatus Cloacimonadota bacterium]|nr:ComF family protein [Candidatus Cloacimonadota bacterium]
MKELAKIVDLFFPSYCFSCSKKLGEENIICDSCRQKIEFIEKNICEKCGTLLENSNCDMCAETNYDFDQARSIFKYEGVIKDLIHCFKYDEKTKISNIFAEYAVDYLGKIDFIDDDYLFVPVPLHKVKHKMRGFNQAELIANSIANLSGNKVKKSIIKRNRFTKTQTKLGKVARIKNLESAFSFSKKFDFRNKKFLIIDDVFTTGTTVNEIAKLLKVHQAKKIKILTIARAKHDS